MGQIIDVIKRQHAKQMKNKWYESYWMIDFHGVIGKPYYELDDLRVEFADKHAQSALIELTNREDIRLILHTSSYPDQVMEYIRLLEKKGIRFDYINENPEIRSYEDFGFYETKPYFDVYLDDKAGFNPKEWYDIFHFLINPGIEKPDPAWKNPNRRRMNPAEISARRRRVRSNVSEQL